MTPSRSACIPLFLKAEPQKTGKILPEIVAAANRVRQLFIGERFPTQVLLEQRVVVLDGGLHDLVPQPGDPLDQRVGHLALLHLRTELILIVKSLVTNDVDNPRKKVRPRRADTAQQRRWLRACPASCR